MTFKALSGDHFEAFCYYHLLHYLTTPIGAFHQELLRLSKYQRIAIAAPRGFAKSTYFSVFYPLFLALERPGTEILIVSATWSLAGDFLAKIRKELDTSRTIGDLYGEQSPKSQNDAGRWTADELQLANGSRIRARGAGQQIRGMRLDCIVVDDLETNETVANPDRTKELDKWIKTDIIGTINEGQLIFAGTILHPESVLSNYIHTPPTEDWITRLYKADGDDGHSPIWPDQWPQEKLDKRRAEIGEYLFEQEYRNNPIPDSARKFKASDIQYFEKDSEPPGCVYFTAIDPAASINNSSDFTAIVTVAIDSEHNFYVVDAINKRMLPNEVIDCIFDVFDRFHPASMGIETVGFQLLLKHEIDMQKHKRGRYPVIVELKPGGRRKNLRIEALQPRVEAKKVYIKKTDTELYSQLVRFPSLSGHDDLIDALAYILDIYRPANKTEGRRLNPNSYDAILEMNRKAKQDQESKAGVWGNHAIYKPGVQ